MKCQFTEINKAGEGKAVCRCVHCGFTLKTKHKPEHIHRECEAPQPFAFGDFIEVVINRLGLGWCGKFYEWATGNPCGCKKRKAWLNKWIRIPTTPKNST